MLYQYSARNSIQSQLYVIFKDIICTNKSINCFNFYPSAKRGIIIIMSLVRCAYPVTEDTKVDDFLMGDCSSSGVLSNTLISTSKISCQTYAAIFFMKVCKKSRNDTPRMPKLMVLWLLVCLFEH